MDFEFITDVSGQPMAKCDVESEYFGDWISHDIGTDQPRIESLLHALEQLLEKRLNYFEFVGKIYHLTIADDEVELFLNNTELTHSEFEDERTEGPVAGCGLVEFKHLLKSWLEFIR